MTAPFDVLKKVFAALHVSQEHTDCQLICGKYTFNLHKAVVTSQSDYFRAAFKKGRFKEGNTSVIQLKYIKDNAENSDDFYDDPEIVKLMVNYFYRFDYCNQTQVEPTEELRKLEELRERLLKKRQGNEDPPSTYASFHALHTPAKTQNFLLTHVKVFATAVKYQVDGLRHLAASKFKHETTHGEAWKDADFAQAISLVYSSTPDEVQELRVLAEEVLHAHFEELKHNKGIEEFMCDHPSLTFKLLKRKSETPVFDINRTPFADPAGLMMPPGLPPGFTEAGGFSLCRRCGMYYLEAGDHVLCR